MARRGAVYLARGDVRITTADRQIEREALNMSILLAASVPVGVALLGCLCLLWLGIGQAWRRSTACAKPDAAQRRFAGTVADAVVSQRTETAARHPEPAVQRIGKTIERERRLTGDAAHELRSPLTAIKTHLQVARMTEGSARDQSLARAEEGADRLHRTLEQLLLLARVEGSLSFDDGVQCSAEVARNWRCRMQRAVSVSASNCTCRRSLQCAGANAGGAVDCGVAQLARQRLRHTPRTLRWN
jgi:signal transduction histidine kinase